MSDRIVVDTSVFVAALIGRRGPNREILRRCLLGQYRPLVGNALFAEYEDVCGRSEILRRCPVPSVAVSDLLEAFCAVCEWVPVYFLWRPKLCDEGDNHVLEVAAAGGARWLVTNNRRDFANAQLAFANLQIVTPEQLLPGE